MPTAEIYKQARIERLWVARLRELFGDEIFQHIIRRILKGDSIREIALYCHNTKPEFAVETYRKWVRALEQQANGPIAQYREQDHAQKAIDEFNRLKAKPNSLVSRLEPDPPSYEVMARLHRNVNKETRKLNTAAALQYLWFCGQKRLDKIMEIEERLPHRNGHQALLVLNKIAANLMRYELGISVLARRGMDGDTLDMEEIDKEVRQLSKFDDVDKNLIHNLQQRFVKLIADEKETNGSTARLESNASTAERIEQTDMPGTDGEPKPSST
jgi:hypothetical protein